MWRGVHLRQAGLWEAKLLLSAVRAEDGRVVHNLGRGRAERTAIVSRDS